MGVWGEEKVARWSASSPTITQLNSDGSDGETFDTLALWRLDWETVKCNELNRLKALRDPASDVTHLPGIKPNFADDWCQNQQDQFTRTVSPGTGTTIIERPSLT